jgi:hypothetical protein
MREAGALNSEIADVLFCSVQAVSDKVKRLNLPKRATGPVSRSGRAKTVKTPEAVERRLRDAEHGRFIGIDALTRSTCRWPLQGEKYCGEAIRAGAVYCPAHCKVAYRKTGAKSDDIV